MIEVRSKNLKGRRITSKFTQCYDMEIQTILIVTALLRVYTVQESHVPWQGEIKEYG